MADHTDHTDLTDQANRSQLSPIKFQARGAGYYLGFALGLLCGAALFLLIAAADPGMPFRFIYEAF